MLQLLLLRSGLAGAVLGYTLELNKAESCSSPSAKSLGSVSVEQQQTGELVDVWH